MDGNNGKRELGETSEESKKIKRDMKAGVRIGVIILDKAYQEHQKGKDEELARALQEKEYGYGRGERSGGALYQQQVEIQKKLCESTLLVGDVIASTLRNNSSIAQPQIDSFRRTVSTEITLAGEVFSHDHGRNTAILMKLQAWEMSEATSDEGRLLKDFANRILQNLGLEK